MTLVNPETIKEIKKFSTKDFSIDACFNCGNCTAVCPVSEEGSEEVIPRTLIRYAQVGLRDKLLGNRLMWLCAYCNDCTETCPRDAEPGEFMMATRRWAMSQYEVTGISRVLNSNPLSGLIAMGFIFILSLFLFGIFGTPSNISSGRPIVIFDLVPKEVIVIVGIGIAGFLLIIIGLSILNMYRLISKEYSTSLTAGFKLAQKTRKTDKKVNTVFHLVFSPFIMVKQAIIVIFKEIFGQYRQVQCTIESSNKQKRREFIIYRWFMHLFIVWGFFGLGVATLLNMFRDIFLGIIPDAYVPITYPIRLLGIFSGIALMLGVTIATWSRYRKRLRYNEHSLICDWILLFNLFVIGLTGFVLTTSYYVTFIPPEVGYWFFVLHMIFVIELVILAPFGKFAHVWYRSFALWIHYGMISRRKKLARELKKEKERAKKAKAEAKKKQAAPA